MAIPPPALPRRLPAVPLLSFLLLAGTYLQYWRAGALGGLWWAAHVLTAGAVVLVSVALVRALELENRSILPSPPSRPMRAAIFAGTSAVAAGTLVGASAATTGSCATDGAGWWLVTAVALLCGAAGVAAALYNRGAAGANRRAMDQWYSDNDGLAARVQALEDERRRLETADARELASAATYAERIGAIVGAPDAGNAGVVSVAVCPCMRSRAGEILRAVAGLAHPHAARILRVDESPDGFALLEERLEGDSLAERLTGGGLHLAEALDVVLQVLAFCHAAGAHPALERHLDPRGGPLSLRISARRVVLAPGRGEPDPVVRLRAPFALALAHDAACPAAPGAGAAELAWGGTTDDDLRYFAPQRRRIARLRSGLGGVPEAAAALLVEMLTGGAPVYQVQGGPSSLARVQRLPWDYANVGRFPAFAEIENRDMPGLREVIVRALNDQLAPDGPGTLLWQLAREAARYDVPIHVPVFERPAPEPSGGPLPPVPARAV